MDALVASGYHVLNADLRGHGQSDWSADRAYHLSDFSADVRALCQSLPTLPVLVGASLGGASSLHAVGNADQAIARALVLVDIVPKIDPQGADRIREFMHANPNGFASVEEVADAVASYNPHRGRPRDPSGLMKNLRRGGDGRLYWHWDPNLFSQNQDPEPPNFAAQLEDAARQVRLPTLLIRGMKSDIVNDAGVAHAKSLMPHLEVINVGAAGHMVAGDKNDLFNEAVIAFLSGLAP